MLGVSLYPQWQHRFTIELIPPQLPTNTLVQWLDKEMQNRVRSLLSHLRIVASYAIVASLFFVYMSSCSCCFTPPYSPIRAWHLFANQALNDSTWIRRFPPRLPIFMDGKSKSCAHSRMTTSGTLASSAASATVMHILFITTSSEDLHK